MPNSFENFNTGMSNLREGLKDVRVAKEKEAKRQQLRQFAQTLDQTLASKQAPTELRNMIQATIAAGGGDADPLQAAKFAFAQLPNYSQNALNKLDAEFTADSRPREVKIPEYQKKAALILQATSGSTDVKIPATLQAGLGSQEKTDQALKEYSDKAKISADKQKDVFQSNYQFAVKNPRPLTAAELQKSIIPSVMDDKSYPPGLSDTDAMNKIINDNPTLPEGTRRDLLAIYQNKQSQDSKVKQMASKYWDMLKQNTYDQVFREANPPPAAPQPSAPQSGLTPTDFQAPSARDVFSTPQ